MNDWPVIAARFALYGDMTLLFGLPLFGLYGLRGEERRNRGLLPLLPLVAALSIAGIILSAIGFIAMAATMSGTGLLEVERGTLTMLLGQTSVGTAFMVRTAALAICLLASPLLPRHRVAALATISVSAGVGLSSLVWSGHGASSEGGAGMAHLGADVVHLLAAGAWVGALLALLAMASRASLKADAAHVRTLHRALDGFACAGTMIVGLIVVTGLINGLFLVGIDDVIPAASGLWGQLMLAKIVLFLGMLAMAAANRFRLTTSLERAIEERDHGQALSTLRRSLALETTMAFGILGLVAWLGTLEPVRGRYIERTQIYPKRRKVFLGVRKHPFVVHPGWRQGFPP